MRFGFFSLTPFSFNLARELLFAGALAAGGDQVVFVSCDGLPRCLLQVGDPAGTDPQARCSACANGTKTLYWEAYRDFEHRLEGVELSNLTDPGRKQALWDEIDTLADDALLDYTYDGMPLGTWTIDNLRIEYLGERWELLADRAVKTRGWLKGAVAAALATESFIRIVQPDCLVVLNGTPVAERTVRHLALRHGVRCLMYEEGQRPDTFVLCEQDVASRYDFQDEWRAWRDASLTTAENQLLDGYLRRRWFASSLADYVYSTPTTADPAASVARLGFAPDRPLLAAFTNVLADTSVFGAQDAFDSLREWADAMVGYAASHPDIDLVVRVHPAELGILAMRDGERTTARDPFSSVIRELWPDLPSNVRIVEADDPISSYDLLRVARLCLVYVTTVGMEAAAMGLPVISAGRSHYSSVGFTWHVPSREAFEPLIDRLVTSPSQPDGAIELARRYMTFWYYRTCYDFPALHALRQTRSHPGGLEGLKQDFNRLYHLASDPHPVMAHLLRHIRGEVAYLPLPPAWRPQDPTCGTPAPPAGPPLLLGLPDWSQIASFVVAIGSLVADMPVPPRVVLLAHEPDAPPVPLAGFEVRVIAADPASVGDLFVTARGVIMAAETDDLDVLALAQQAMVPCFGLDDEDLAGVLADLLQVGGRVDGERITVPS